MQGDLISRSALIEKFKDKSGIWTGTSKYLIQVIENQPTAYDVEKVVAELKEIEIPKPNDLGEYIGGYVDYEKTIEIVRNGGKE